MSKYGEYLKSRKEKDIKFFFGDDAKMLGSNNPDVEWKRVKSDDQIILVTNDVRYWRNKDQYVLLVDNDKVVYLKEWQVCEIKNWKLGQDSYAVKLNRQFFKAYKMPFEFDDMAFEKENTFDDLLKVAKAQDAENIVWKLGHYGF